MNNKPHSEATKKKMSEAQKRRWANMTQAQRDHHKKRIKDFWDRVEQQEEEKRQREFDEAHKEYIWNEFNRLFGD